MIMNMIKQILKIKTLPKAVSNLITLFHNLLKYFYSIMVLICTNNYELSSVHLKNCFLGKKRQCLLRSLFSLLYIGALFFIFILIFEYTLIDMFQIIIFFLFSLAVFLYISDDYKFSNNKFLFF